MMDFTYDSVAWRTKFVKKADMVMCTIVDICR